MKRFLLRWFASGISIYLTAKLFHDITLAGFGTAMITAVILGFANMVIKPIILLFTLPINILTLGLFTLVVNGFVLKIAAAFVIGFSIRGLWGAIMASIVLSVIHMAINGLLGLDED